MFSHREGRARWKQVISGQAQAEKDKKDSYILSNGKKSAQIPIHSNIYDPSIHLINKYLLFLEPLFKA